MSSNRLSITIGSCTSSPTQ
uniref:Uncharacterized protein n=1 Tax=Arundo donax TaxID=35708 RepID=A0A0A8Y3Z5_ARUDO